MSSEAKKCAHANCSCVCEKGEKFCSQYCKDAAKTMTLGCDCRHPACTGHM